MSSYLRTLIAAAAITLLFSPESYAELTEIPIGIDVIEAMEVSEEAEGLAKAISLFKVAKDTYDYMKNEIEPNLYPASVPEWLRVIIRCVIWGMAIIFTERLVKRDYLLI